MLYIFLFFLFSGFSRPLDLSSDNGRRDTLVSLCAPCSSESQPAHESLWHTFKRNFVSWIVGIPSSTISSPVEDISRLGAQHEEPTPSITSLPSIAIKDNTFTGFNFKQSVIINIQILISNSGESPYFLTYPTVVSHRISITPSYSNQSQSNVLCKFRGISVDGQLINSKDLPGLTLKWMRPVSDMLARDDVLRLVYQRSKNIRKIDPKSYFAAER